MKRKKEVNIRRFWAYISRMWGAKLPGRIEPKFFFGSRYPRHNHVLQIWWRSVQGLASAGGQTLPFPIDFDGRPYNTLTLPCKRVISHPTLSIHYATFLELRWRIRGVLSMTSNVKGQIERTISKSKNLQNFDLLGALLGIKWYHHVRSDEVRRTTGQPRLSAIVQARRLSLFGHIARMPDETDARSIITAPPSDDWRKPPGRLRTTWMKTISKTWDQTVTHWMRR